MNMKKVGFAAIALLAALGLAACSGGGGQAAKDVTLQAEDIKFDQTTLNAAAGQQINVSLHNVGALEHSFVIDELNARIDKVQPGQTGTASFTPASAGTFVYYCDIPGHKEAGMTGTLTVNP